MSQSINRPYTLNPKLHRNPLIRTIMVARAAPNVKKANKTDRRVEGFGLGGVEVCVLSILFESSGGKWDSRVLGRSVAVAARLAWLLAYM